MSTVSSDMTHHFLLISLQAFEEVFALNYGKSTTTTRCELLLIHPGCYLESGISILGEAEPATSPFMLVGLLPEVKH